MGPKGWAGETETVEELLEPGPLGCRAATACSNGHPCPQSSWTCLSSQLVFPFDFHPSFPSAPTPDVASSSVCCRSRDAHALLLEADAPQLPMDMGPADGQSPFPSTPCSRSWGSPGTAEGHSSGTSPSRDARSISAAAPSGMGSFQLGGIPAQLQCSGCQGQDNGTSDILGWREHSPLWSSPDRLRVSETVGNHQRHPHLPGQVQRPPLPVLPLLPTEPLQGSHSTWFSLKSLPQPSDRSSASVSPWQCFLVGVFKKQHCVMWSGYPGTTLSCSILTFFGQLFSYCVVVYLSGLFETSSLLKPTN